MKIQKISYSNNINIKKAKTPNAVYRNYKTDNLSFRGLLQPEKDNFFDRLIKKMAKKTVPQMACYLPRENPTNLTSDERKSENIKGFIRDTIASYKFVEKKGEDCYKELSRIMELGAKNNYKATPIYDDEDNIVATFNPVDKKLGIPTTVSVWENGKFEYSYTIKEKEPKLKYSLTVKQGDITTTHDAEGSMVTRFFQQNDKLSTVKQMDMTETGFNYLYGRIHEDDSDVEIIKRLYFDFSNIKGCIYAQDAPEGIALYMYDFENDLWEQTHIIEFEEE